MTDIDRDRIRQGGRLWRWLPVGLWLVLIFTLSSLPLNDQVVRMFRHQDKLIHFIEYGILGLLLARAVFDPHAGLLRYWICIGVAVLVGAVDEFHQSFIPGRMMDWHDLLADTTGAVLFVWVWLAFNRNKMIRKPATTEEQEN